MSYQDVIYGHYKKSDYPNALAKYLAECYFGHLSTRVLDLGCGNGRYVEEFKKLGLEATGIDLDQCDFENEKLPYQSDSFDVVFCKSVIEHIKDPTNMIQEVKRVLGHRGRAVFLCPSWEHNYRWFFNDPTHVKPYHRKGIRDLFRLAGFKHVKVEYFYHLPFIWKYPISVLLAKLISKLPDDWSWKDFNQQEHNVLIRFSKEVQILTVAFK